MKRLLNYILAIFTFASMAVVLVGCGKKVPLTEDQWRSATTQRDFVNSSFTLNSDCYELEDRTKKVFSLELDVKLNEQNISVDKKTTYASSNPSIDGLVTEYKEYYTLELGTWVHGAVYYKDGEPDSYNKGTVEAENVKPFNVIELIFGKAPDECIGSKFNEIEIDGSKYIYRDDQKELVFTFEDQGKGYWYRVDTVDFKWVRAPGDTEYYEEGHIKFYDYKNTTVTVPNEINMGLFCLNYVVDNHIVEFYDTHNNYSLSRLGHYMIDDKYSIVSVRQASLFGDGEAMIYFGGQMSTDILALPYTVRKGTETRNGVQANVFYLDVDSDVISDIKCYCVSEHQLFPSDFGGYDSLGEYGYKTWPISFYTGKGMAGSVYISYKVNGVEYVASSTTRVSYVVDAEHGSENGKPICMFYNFNCDLAENNDLNHARANTYNTILRTDKQIFAFDYDYFYRVDPVVEDYYFTYELNDELREEQRNEYGKIFFATKIYILDITNYEKDSRGFIKLDEEGTNLSLNITLNVQEGNKFTIKVYGNNLYENASEHSVNLECVRTEGIVNYYVFSNND